MATAPKKRAPKKKTLEAQIAETAALPVAPGPEPVRPSTKYVAAGVIGMALITGLNYGVHQLPDLKIPDIPALLSTDTATKPAEEAKPSIIPELEVVVKEKNEVSEVRSDVVVLKLDGRTETRTGGSVSWRYNNPALIYMGDYAKSVGAIGSDGKYAIFPSYEAGRKAVQSLLFTSGQGYKEKTLEAAMRFYAPKNEGFNTDYYLRAITKDTGIPLTKVMETFSEKEQKLLLDTLEKIERFRAGKVESQ